ncbi:histone-arginine methyltransferase METTL23-like isoform X1 [Halichondria panicea]|uniref:histone-arginine methyltransferase METTL23-like isoform X1 n=1 Tax=Halichondria panicea TaxID=6063 RepID=UPI00312B38DD
MSLIIKSIEQLGGDYSLYTWPCALLLAQHIYDQKEFIGGKKVLELGAGTAIPGLTAAKCGGHVTFTDREGNTCFQNAIKRSCDLNGIEGMEITEVTWGLFSPTLLTLPPQDVIIASDCFYDSKDFEDVLATVSFLMDKNPSCKFWTTYQERSSNRTLVHLLERWGLEAAVITVDTNSPKDRVVVEGLSESRSSTEHTLHLWEITSRNSI